MGQRWRILLTGVVLAATGVVAAPGGTAVAATPRVMLEGSGPASHGAQDGGALGRDAVVRFRVVLSSRAPAVLKGLAKARADRRRVPPGGFMTPRQVADRFGPSSGAVTKVTSWLRGSGLAVEQVLGDRSFLSVSGTAEQVERAFGTSLRQYHSPIRNWHAPATTPSVPADIAAYVSGLDGLDERGSLAAPPPAAHLEPLSGGMRPLTDGDTACASYWGERNNSAVKQQYPSGFQSNAGCGYTASQVQHLYGTQAYTGAGQTVAVVGAYASPTIVDDVNAYSQQMNVPTLAAGQLTQVNDPPVSNPDCASADQWTLNETTEIEAIHALAPAAKIVYVGAKDCTDFLTALTKVVTGRLASIVVVPLATPVSQVPAATQTAWHNALLSAENAGVGVYVPSGDSGDNSTITGVAGVNYPASDTDVVAVGGTTTALDGSGGIIFETGWESRVNQLVNGAWQPLAAPFGGGAGGWNPYIETVAHRPAAPDSLDLRPVPDVSALADPNTGFFVRVTLDGSAMGGAVGGTGLATALVAAGMADVQQGTGQVFGFARDTISSLDGYGIRDVRHVDSGIYVPWGPDGSPGDYLYDNDVLVQSLRSDEGEDYVTGLGDLDIPTAVAALLQLPYPDSVEGEDVVNGTTVTGGTVVVGSGSETCCWTTAELGKFWAWTGASAGATASFPINVHVTGVYALDAQFLTSSDSAIVQLLLDGQPLREPHDLSNDYGYLEPDLGTANLTEGTHTVTVKMIGVYGSRVDLDYLHWTPASMPTVVEGESLASKATATAGIVTQNDSTHWSGGQQLMMTSTKVGDQLAVPITVATTGFYDVSAMFTYSSGYGVVQASLDGQPLGRPYNLYGNRVGTISGLLDNTTLTAGQHTMSFTVVGKAAGSTGYQVGFDYLLLTPAPATTKYEGEDLVATGTGDVGADIQSDSCCHRIAWSGTAQAYVHALQVGNSYTVKINVAHTGDYDLIGAFTYSWDYGTFLVSVDGPAYGGVILDMQAHTPIQGRAQWVGDHHLEQGQHTVTFTIVDKDPLSQGYGIGIDYLRLALHPPG